MSIIEAVTVGDQEAIAGVPKRIVAAWAGQDAEAFAEVFTEDGTMILPGVLRNGRDEIRSYMDAAFSGAYKGTRVMGTPQQFRILADDVVLLITRGGVLAADEQDLPDGRAVHASWLVVRRDRRWQLAAYQNSPAGA